MGIDVFDIHPGRAGDLELAVALHRLAQRGGQRAEHHAHIATNRQAFQNLLVALGGGHLHFHKLVPLEDGQVRVLDFHEEALARLELLGALILLRHCRAHLFQRGNRPPVMTLLEMAEADVIIGLVDLLAHGEFLDDPPHHLEALAVVACLIKARAGFQHRLGTLFLVAILLAGHCLEMHARLVVGVLARQIKLAQLQSRLEAHATARVALDDRFPNLHRLRLLARIKTQLARLQQLPRRAILNDGSAHRLLCGRYSGWERGGKLEDKNGKNGEKDTGSHVKIRRLAKVF